MCTFGKVFTKQKRSCFGPCLNALPYFPTTFSLPQPEVRKVTLEAMLTQVEN